MLLLSFALATPPVAAPMHEHFLVATQIRDELIHGQLDAAKATASQLTDLEPPEGLPGTWRPWMAAVKSQATEVASATSLDQASVALGGLAAACADCHQELQGGPGLERMHDVPPQKWAEGANMPLHRWAVDWLWLGLIAPDEEAWRRGASSLDDRPLTLLFGDLPPDATPRKLEERVYGLAGKASELSETQRTERGQVFGELLGTCASCHALRNQGKVLPPVPTAPVTPP